MAIDKFYIDDEFLIENNLPEYEDNGICDDCYSKMNGWDETPKRVKCIGADGIYFCDKHWKNYVLNMFNGPEGEGGLKDEDRCVVEPFDVSRDLIRDGAVLHDGSPDFHMKSNC